MTRDELKAMADACRSMFGQVDLTKFATLVAAAQREKDARICDVATERLNRFGNYVGADETNACAAAIRRQE